MAEMVGERITHDGATFEATRATRVLIDGCIPGWGIGTNARGGDFGAAAGSVVLVRNSVSGLVEKLPASRVVELELRH